MPDISAIHEFLRDAHVPYTVVPHSPAFTAQEEAAATRVPGSNWAKVVVCFVDGDPIQAVLPASCVVNLNRLLELVGGGALRLAEQKELEILFPGCDAGAMPPLGPMYGQSVYVDVALAAQPELVFNAGTFVDAIAMRWADFARAVRPIVGNFADPLVDHVGLFRLSYRE